RARSQVASGISPAVLLTDPADHPPGTGRLRRCTPPPRRGRGTEWIGGAGGGRPGARPGVLGGGGGARAPPAPPRGGVGPPAERTPRHTTPHTAAAAEP